MEFPSVYLLLLPRVGFGNFLFPGRNMEATNVRGHKVHLYRSWSWSSSSAVRDKVSFISISSSSSSSSYQRPIGLHKQKKKKVSHGVSSFEWVMIRRNLNLSLRRFGADNKGILITTTNQIPEQLLLLRHTKQQQQQQHRLVCVGEESSSEMGDEEVKFKKQEDGSVEEKMKGKEVVEEKDLGTPLKSPSLPTPPSPPEKPLPGDCCGNGCIPCVWDTYNEELEDYKNLLKDYNNLLKDYKP